MYYAGYFFMSSPVRPYQGKYIYFYQNEPVGEAELVPPLSQKKPGGVIAHGNFGPRIRVRKLTPSPHGINVAQGMISVPGYER
jgi:hypothetical protein